MHTLTVKLHNGIVYTNVMTSDVAVMRLALVRAVEEWFDLTIAPEFKQGRLDHFPPLEARVW